MNAQQVNYIVDSENGTSNNCLEAEQRVTESAFDVAMLVGEALQIKGQVSQQRQGTYEPTPLLDSGDCWSETGCMIGASKRLMRFPLDRYTWSPNMPKTTFRSNI